jgi:hypothetical protein
MNIYCFSGLGADEHVFDGLIISGATLHFVPWIEPLKHETLPLYSKRLGNSVSFESPYCLMGLSFGGMIAYELNPLLNPEHTFLISSATHGKEINPFLWLAGKMKLQQIIPPFILQKPGFLAYYFFGLKTSEEKAAFREIMKNTSPKLLKWAMQAIVNWQPKHKAEVVRVHGKSDHIIPCPKTDIELEIDRGTHFCILQRADEISKFIQNQLA